MKKLIDEEVSTRASDRRSTPSVVARLMGMDSLPSDAKPTIFPGEGSKDPKPRNNPTTSTQIRKTGQDSLAYYGVKNNSRQTTTKLQPREHPQEEVLQKFKKEFEEWQASRAWEHSSSYGVQNHRRRKNVTDRFPAQEQLARRVGPKHYVSIAKESGHGVRIGKQSTVTNSRKKQDRPSSSSSSPTRIVILKPGAEGSWPPRSPEALEKEGSMEDFLEEVKERLRSEMLGNARSSTTGAGDVTAEASFGERSPDTKQFARDIAKRIKESATKDIRSAASTSSDQLERRPESPKFVNRDARRLFSRMAKERARSQSIDDFSNLGNNFVYTTTRNESNAAPVPTRNLVRSFSAPSSGTAFGRLLLEDQHVPTGAHIRRKHEEASELPRREPKKKRKDGFNLRGTVSSLRHNFTIKSKLFGKKVQLADEREEDEFSSPRPIATVPSVVEKFGFVQDNSTEVPPSPASLTDSSQDDLFRADHPSPVSPLETAFVVADQPEPKLSSSTFPELEEVSEQADHGGRDEVAADENPFDDHEDHIEGYIRNILVAAGLYDAPAVGESLPRWNGSTKPIPNWVFDKLEETYSRGNPADGGEPAFRYRDADLSRRMLFDLVNEALPRVLEFKSPGPDTVPHGKALLDGLWSRIERNLSSRSNGSGLLDDTVAEDVRTAPWCGDLRADEEAVGRRLEWMIVADVIDELVQDVLDMK
ncbi:uncharacterized protein M6B38_259955 [Iris pallida]|uniref:DUF4378 domain-containing protein n=1 Tax=Iris pallida TaxID=29817 RepID=A0AAX6IEF3_IRIPA|nr:uncharacterized protein M6B38_259955 [Iris pallida]